MVEGLHELVVGFAEFFFFPLASRLDESFACDVLDEVGVLLAVFVEELVGECLDGKGCHEVLEGDAFFLKYGEAFDGCLVEQVGEAEDVGVAFWRGGFTFDVADE